ncbi:hypothetical protein SAMN04489717_3692 [Actinopolymorpha singaporensis]|uniref:Uncharacterized protein n=1 Tax=Actinopolymorpha singaporensis TaxID=117157 RepID=A0A1H1UMB8_9ACTN|nr:hypothetical protein SAMN04489717_3692 [Actinopolymorpha singaporensis]
MRVRDNVQVDQKVVAVPAQPATGVLLVRGQA